jgi:excinuclease ABC subunit C
MGPKAAPHSTASADAGTPGNRPSALNGKLAGLPTKPGVYLMKDSSGQVIYVGKAVNLRSRVRSYFHSSADLTLKLQRLVGRIADLDVIVTDSELEALILECTLIKRHCPRFNVRFKDDKRYPYIKVAWQDPYPRVLLTRRMVRDGSAYYGPYTSSLAARESLEFLRLIFKYRTCKRDITGEDERPCLYFDIGRCSGPCIGALSQDEYRANIRELRLFLEGKGDEIIRDVRSKMETASDSLDFEAAAVLRDRLRSLECVVEQQKVVSSAAVDQDVIAFALANGDACVQVFFIRHGKLIGREYFLLVSPYDDDSREIMTSFVKQFYDDAAYVPQEVLLQSEVDEPDIIRRWLRDKRGGKVALRVPLRGRKRQLVEMAATNAAETLSQLRAQFAADREKQVQALAQLQEHLGLEEPLGRIECYDISNIQGQAATGSMVTFVRGAPDKRSYRHFRIRTVEGADDYAMMREVIRRRVSRAREGQAKPGKDAWAMLPDLMIVDGGKGQLNAARDILEEFGFQDLPIAGLAKAREELFLPGEARPRRLPGGSQALFLVQRIRDEAHRFAISHHRKLRRKASLASELEDIPGIGPKRRRALLKRFGSLDAIRQASVEELASTETVSRELARRVKESA